MLSIEQICLFISILVKILSLCTWSIVDMRSGNLFEEKTFCTYKVSDIEPEYQVC